MISNCGHDERWQYAGGAAGDNNGTEWTLVPWYSYPWDVMIRYPDANIRHWMGAQATAAAKNDNIGYDQWQRQTFWANLADSDYDAAQITVRCETDCSAGVLAICKAAGYFFNVEALKKINQNGYTGNEEQILRAAGFEIHREAKYLTSGAYLDNGDVLLNTQNHTAFNVTRGDRCDANDVVFEYEAHVQTYGWRPWVLEGNWCGTQGQSKRLEALRINPPAGVVLEVDAHLQNIGWKTYTDICHGNDIIIGTVGESRRLEAVIIRVIKNRPGLTLTYQAHVQTYGTMPVVKEGEIAGTYGESKRLEDLRIYFR